MEGMKGERRGGKSWKREREERERKRVTNRGPGSYAKGRVCCIDPDINSAWPMALSLLSYL